MNNNDTNVNNTMKLNLFIFFIISPPYLLKFNFNIFSFI